VAGGYVINDWFDVETDKFNKPDKVLIPNVFSQKEAKLFYVILTFIGLATGLISSIMVLNVDFYVLFAVIALIACLLYSYSSTYKRKLLVGNLIVSSLVAIAVFLPYIFEILYLSDNLLMLSTCKELAKNIVYFVLIYTIFAFVLTFIREIIKDVEDVDGDGKTHCRTIPVVYGLRKTKTILYVFVIFLLILLSFYGFILFELELFMTFSCIIIVGLSSLLLILKIYKAKEYKEFIWMSVLAKVMMFIGLLSMVFLR
jgi:4-hydroxybenzoate polyprenyltransferase